MNLTAIIGGLTVGVPSMILATVLFARRDQMVFVAVFMLIVVSLGYMGSTGSLEDVGRQLIEILRV